jgi:hypothetical protein
MVSNNAEEIELLRSSGEDVTYSLSCACGLLEVINIQVLRNFG